MLVAYAVVGFGAAAYSPAKYGILTELLPPEQLVAANGWIEGTTVGSIILGTVLGGALVSGAVSTKLLGFDMPMIDTFVDSAPEAAIIVIAVFYGIAALFNRYIPDTGVDHRMPSRNIGFLIREFSHCVKLLWRDKLGQISLATTTLFWGAGATLQFIVLKWAETALGINLSQAAILQARRRGRDRRRRRRRGDEGDAAAGGLDPAGRRRDGLDRDGARDVRPHARPQGAFELALSGRAIVVPYYVLIACAILMLVGGLAGFFVVPMNALLQHRGHVLMGAGHSIAVQNFNENLSILAMLAGYAAMIRADLPIKVVILIFGLFVSGSMLLVLLRHRRNQARGDLLHLIGVEKTHWRRSAIEAMTPHASVAFATPIADRLSAYKHHRPVRDLVDVAAAAREVLGEQRRDLAHPVLDAIDVAAGAERLLPCACRSPPTRRRRPCDGCRGRRRSRRRGPPAADRAARRCSPRCPRRAATRTPRAHARAARRLRSTRPSGSAASIATQTWPRCIASPAAIACSMRFMPSSGNARRTSFSSVNA